MKKQFLTILAISVFIAGLFVMAFSFLFKALKNTVILNIDQPGVYVFQVTREPALPQEFDVPAKIKK